ncbi:MAG: restriction endonuclease, partial [Thermotaleaceae bacterium]
KKWKDYRESKNIVRKLIKYYQEDKGDAASSLGKGLDFLGMRGFVFFCSFFLFQFLIEDVIITSFISILWTGIYHITDVKKRRLATKEMIERRRRYFGGQKIYKEWIEKSNKEFRQYIQTVFEKSGFEKVKDFSYHEKRSYLLYQYNGEILPLLYKQNRYNDNVQFKEIESFVEQLEQDRFAKGIFLTTSDFTKESYDYVKENYEKKIILIERETLLKIVERAGLFPNIEEIDEYVMDRVEKKEQKISAYKEALLSKSKVKRYLILSAFLLFWAPFTPYYSYYNFMGILIFGLAILTFYCNIKRKEDIHKEFDFQQIIKSE